ncbi:hypothetical protein [Mycolicibacterium xanthum]|uniref:hypothetical protein n=1 Tax=Mycolicibacterium xanthum TaxID=2796469 RepID=UPI0021081868|nr:hypothetical protein [Mycolicibacterium xanthum]
MSAAAMRAIELGRAAWGAALLADPDAVLGTVHGLTVDDRSRVVARILGARQLTQATLSGLRPTPEVLAMGTWVDAVHALTALGLVVVDRSRARAGITDAVIAAGWAGAGWRDLRRAAPTPPAHRRVRDRLAVRLLHLAPGGRGLLRAAQPR